VIDLLGNRFPFTYNYRGERIGLGMPGGISRTFAFDLDGRFVGGSIANNSSSPFKSPDVLLRKDTLIYIDARSVATASNAWGYRDTTMSRYSGLGHLVRMQWAIPVNSVWGVPARLTSVERFNTDPMGNVYWAADTTNVSASTYYHNLIDGRSTSYGPLSGGLATGRLRASSNFFRTDTVEYDLGGNTELTYQSTTIPDDVLLEDRASYYGPDGRLRVTDYRRVLKTYTGIYMDPSTSWKWYETFEEYRYDPLGRRVMVRTRRNCRNTGFDPCEDGTIRRVAWDGAQELAEVQMPGSDTVSATTMDNDTLALQRSVRTTPAYYDPNILYGRVAYTHAAGIDQPLSVTRINYADDPFNDAYVAWPPMSLVPHWSWRGYADFGTFGDGGVKNCLSPTSSHCVSLRWRFKSFAFTQTASDSTRWHGTLLVEKEDASGLLYRRNRYVEPATGRFTQEDPIGLAGGLNLYGFANGDPTNFGDPFGLCPDPLDPDCPSNFWLQLQNRSKSWYGKLGFAVMGGLAHLGEVGGALADFLSPGECTDDGVCYATFPAIGPRGSSLGRIPKPINLPSWRRISIDIEHIARRHMVGGAEAGPRKDLFPEGLTPTQVLRLVKEAYRYARRVGSQGARVLVRGEADGMTIEMWVNTETRTIETAYPVP